jgi:hypothetical protein
VGRGQEFVLDCDDYPESINWLIGLLTEPTAGRGPSPFRDGAAEDRAAWAKLCNLQRRTLPQVAPPVGGFRQVLAYRPAFVVTGDYHDFIRRPDGRTATFVGDGSGHGPAASMLMAIMRTILQTPPTCTASRVRP